MDGFLISVDFGKMKVPIRSKLTFCVSCSKSFKVHFKYKKYFIDDSWFQKKWIGRYLAC